MAELAAAWGDAWSAHDAYVGVYAGARETEADRVRELLRNWLPLLMRVFGRVRASRAPLVRRRRPPAQPTRRA